MKHNKKPWRALCVHAKGNTFYGFLKVDVIRAVLALCTVLYSTFNSVICANIVPTFLHCFCWYCYFTLWLFSCFNDFFYTFRLMFTGRILCSFHSHSPVIQPSVEIFVSISIDDGYMDFVLLLLDGKALQYMNAEIRIVRGGKQVIHPMQRVN